uniref:Bromodomain adjacent to zinc finger domain protein 2A n=1 Tax=Schistocephalus solidus TaxID=70667 RepID=A0A0X3PAH0_SCHSO
MGDPIEQVIVPGLPASSCGPNTQKASFENDFALFRPAGASAPEFNLPRFLQPPPLLSPAMTNQLPALWSPWLPPLGTAAGGGSIPVLSTAASINPPPPPPLKLSDLPSLQPHLQQQALGLSSLNSLTELEKLREFFVQLVKDQRRLEDEKEVQLKTHRRTQLEKLKEQRIEKLIQAELKRPVEDLRLLNQEPLPAFDPIKGNKMSSKMFADCLLTVEFLHVFTEVLCIDSETIPSLGTLQSALVDRNRSCLDAVTHVIVELLKFAILDPGIPSPRLVTQLLGLRFSEMEVNSSTVTGLLRVFLIGRRGYEDEMSDWLAPTNVSHLSELSGDKLAALLAFVCDELVCSSRLISTEIDRTIDLQASLRREKFNLENKIRRIRILLARKFGTDMNVAQLYSGSQHNTDPQRVSLDESSKSTRCAPSPTESIDAKVKRLDYNHTVNSRDIDETEPTMFTLLQKTALGSESGAKFADAHIRQTVISSATCFAASPNASAAVSAAAIAAAYNSGDEEDVDTAEELEKRLETLNQVLEAKQLAIDECSYRLSGIYLGQDRYFRNYFVLGSVGGIFVEGQDIFGLSNSSQDKGLGVRVESSGTLFDPELIVAEIRASRELAVKRHYNFSGTAGTSSASSSSSSSSFRCSHKDTVSAIPTKPEPMSASLGYVLSPVSTEGGDISEPPTNHPPVLNSKQDEVNFGATQLKLSNSDSASHHERKADSDDHWKSLPVELNVKVNDQDPASSKETCSISPAKNIEEEKNLACGGHSESDPTVGTPWNPSYCEPGDADFVCPVKCEETHEDEKIASGSKGSPEPDDVGTSEGDPSQSSCQPLDLSNKKIQNGAVLESNNGTSTPSSNSFANDVADYILWNSFTEQDLSLALEESGLDEPFLTTAGLLFATQTGLLDRTSMGSSCSLNDPACHVVVLFYKLQILRALAYEMKKSVAVPKIDQKRGASLLTSSLRQLKVWLCDGARNSSEDGSRFCDSDPVNVDDTELLPQVDELLEKRGVQLQPLPTKKPDETIKDDEDYIDVNIYTHLPPQEFTNCWWRIHDLETLQSLLGALSPRGIRERMLVKSIQRNEETVGPSVLVDASSVIDLHTVSAALADGWSPNLLRVRSRRGKGRGNNVPFIPTPVSTSSLISLGATGTGSALLASAKSSHSCNPAVSLSTEAADRPATAELPSHSSFSLRQQSNNSSHCGVVHQADCASSSAPEDGADDALVTSMSSDPSTVSNVEQGVGLADADSGDQEFLEECQCLERIEGLVDRALSASLQVKGWQAPIKAMDDDSIHLIPRATPKRSRFEQWPLDVARERLRDLEAHLERRYLLPPLNCESHLDVVARGEQQEEEVSTLPSPVSQEHAHCVTGVSGGPDTTNMEGSTCSDSNSTPAHSETSEVTVPGPSLPHIRRVVRPAVPTSNCGRGTPASETEAGSVVTNGQSAGSATTSSGSGQFFLPPALLEWRQNVTRASSVEALNGLAKQLEAAVAWDKSIMKAICQICRRDKNEAQLLLCDGCDHGYHTYCFRPPLISIPLGDWFCFNCISKATGKRHCFVCGVSRPVLPPPPRLPALNNTTVTSSAQDPAHRLVVCCTCSRAVHPACLRPPAPRLPRRWRCSFCLSRGATFERVTQPTSTNKSATVTPSAPVGTAAGVVDANQSSSSKAVAETSRDGRANIKNKRKLAPQVAISDKRQCIRPDFKAHVAQNQPNRKAAGPVCTRGRRPKCASSLPPNSSGSRLSGSSKSRQDEQQHSLQQNVCRFSDLLPKHQKQQKQRRQQRKMLLLKKQRHQAANSLVCFSAKRPLKRGKLPPRVISTNADGGCNYAPLSSVDFDKELGSANGYLGVRNQPGPGGLLPGSDLGSVVGSSSLETPSQSETRGTSRPKRSRTMAGKLRQPMSTVDLEFCRRATEDLISHEASWPFRRPVSSKDVPLYRKVIKRPIDLSTILKRLSDEKARTYSLDEWLCDVRLIFRNCEVFNEDDSDIGRAGHFMHRYFENKWGSTADVLRKREAAVCPSLPTPLTSSPNPYAASQAPSIAPPISKIDLNVSLPSTLLEVSTDDQSTLALEESETTQPANDSHFDSLKNVSVNEDGTAAADEGGSAGKATELTELMGDEPESGCPPDSSSLLSAPCPGVQGSSSFADLRTSPARDSIAT